MFQFLVMKVLMNCGDISTVAYDGWRNIPILNNSNHSQICIYVILNRGSADYGPQAKSGLLSMPGSSFFWQHSHSHSFMYNPCDFHVTVTE